MGRTRKNRRGGGWFKSKKNKPLKSLNRRNNIHKSLSNLRSHLSETVSKRKPITNMRGRILSGTNGPKYIGFSNGNPEPGEIEVFRIEPKVGKCYEYIEATRKHRYLQTYYSTNKYKYVGKFVKTRRFDRDDVTYIFDNDGEKVEVELSYEGMSCFKEVDCK